jgi:GMP reductase
MPLLVEVIALTTRLTAESWSPVSRIWKPCGRPGSFQCVAQEAVAESVEGADPHAAHGMRKHRVEPCQHLLRRLVGEGDGEHAARRELAGLDQPGDARGEDARLAGAGAGEDQRRLRRQGDGGELLGIQALQQARRRGLLCGCNEHPPIVRQRPAATGWRGIARDTRGEEAAHYNFDAPSMEIFDYDNVLLLPRKCRVESRSECDASLEFGPRRSPAGGAGEHEDGRRRADRRMAGGQRILLRDAPLRRRQRGVRAAHARQEPAGLDQLRRQAPRLRGHRPSGQRRVGADYVTIDIAHGHADTVQRMIEHIKTKLPEAFVIAGNVATPEAVIDLENWGADATKVGVGPGKVCITKLKTGFGTGGWQLSALKWCARVATRPIIADGGIRDHGDIAKSVRFGACMVMIGSLFAGHEESPGRTVEVDGVAYKEYYGSASDFNKGEHRHVEGKRILEPIKGRLADTLREMEEDVQSSISYAGGTRLADIRKVNYVILGGDNAGEHLLM